MGYSPALNQKKSLNIQPVPVFSVIDCVGFCASTGNFISCGLILFIAGCLTNITRLQILLYLK